MRLTAFTDFGLRVLMALAAAPGRRVTTDALAVELAVSRHHLGKVVQALAAGGWVITARGARGGLALSRPAAEIPLGAVVRRLEAGQPLVECFRADGGRCVLTPGCGLRGLLAEAAESFLATLDRRSLADCVGGKPRARLAADGGPA